MKEKIFELLVEMMLAAGGDGSSVLMCDDWQKAANDFTVWSNINHPEFFERHDSDDMITFIGNGIGTQEGVTITSYNTEQCVSSSECMIKTLLF